MQVKSLQYSSYYNVINTMNQYCASMSIQNLEHTLLIFHVKQIDLKTASDSDK
jgi:hypothetical protein